MLLYKSRNSLGRHAAGLSDTRHLKQSVSRRDVGVEARSRGCEHVRRQNPASELGLSFIQPCDRRSSGPGAPCCGPRFEAAVFAALYGASTVLVGSSGSGARVAEGRPWNHFGSFHCCPISREPIIELSPVVFSAAVCLVRHDQLPDCSNGQWIGKPRRARVSPAKFARHRLYNRAYCDPFRPVARSEKTVRRLPARRERLLFILVSRFLLSSSSHVAEPFSAHCGQVTGVTNRSRLAIEASCPMFARVLMGFGLIVAVCPSKRPLDRI